jgi:glycosyltransferase involved in cell wall biosynthesis
MAAVLVSVIIPTYNYARYVRQAVDSALAQSYPDREIIVVDDGSTDNTRQVLQDYGDKIAYIYQANQGLSAARNTGIRAARGDFIALLDSDDLWHPRKLELQVDCLTRHPEIGLLATEQFTDRGEDWPPLGDDPARACPLELTLDEVVGKARFGPSSAVIRRRCFDVVGFFDPGLRCVEDRDMWVRLASRFGLAKLPLPLMWYRVHPSSLSSKSALMEQHELRVLNKLFAEIPALRGRRLFRRKTFGQAAFAAGQLYRDGGQKWRAVHRILKSIWLWPLPLRMHGDGRLGIRSRVLLNLLLRSMGLKADEPRQKAVGSASNPMVSLSHRPVQPASTGPSGSR